MCFMVLLFSTIQLKILLFLNTDDTYDDTQGVLCTRDLFL